MAAQKKLRVTVTVPEGFNPGDQFMIEVDVPQGQGRVRNTKAIEEMTKEELKREIINANSVLYKAQKRGADQEIIDKNQQRLDAAKALMAEKFPAEVKERKAADGSTVKIIEATARVLTQDEIDNPEAYVGDTNEEVAAEL
jgi:hypothetical protein